MCTAIEHDGCFGRTLDLDVCYPFYVTVTPRQFSFTFSEKSRHAMIGMATVANGQPLYYEAANEHGLGMAALRFARCAVYHPDTDGTVASFELIPWVLSQCATLQEARERLRGVRISTRAFSPDYPPTPLHWFLADRSGAVAIEPLAEGLRLCDDPVRVLTNAPPFARQAAHWTKFVNASQNAEMPNGLPGDWSSLSRFVRAAFAATHAPTEETDAARVAALFRLLHTVAVPRGCVKTDKGEYHSTMYTCCYDTVRQEYHYTTANRPQVHCVPLGDPCGTELRIYK